MFTYILKPDLPAVPDVFCDQARLKAQSAEGPGYVAGTDSYNTRRIQLDGTSYQTRRQLAYPMGPEWERWVDENLGHDWIETGVRVNLDNGSPVHGPHVDSPPSKFKLYWLVDAGGTGIMTSWYQQKNHPLHRKPEVTVNDYNDLIEIDRIEIPTNQWILFNGNIIHGVRNLQGTRINLTVSFPIDHPLLAQCQFLHRDFQQLT